MKGPNANTHIPLYWGHCIMQPYMWLVVLL